GPRPGRKAAWRRARGDGAGTSRGGIWKAAVLLGGVGVTAFTRGSAAGLWFGLVLGAAFAAWLSLRLWGAASASLDLRRDLPWLVLAGLGWVWVVAGAAPDAGCRVALEATGLLAAGWMARARWAGGAGAVGAGRGRARAGAGVRPRRRSRRGGAQSRAAGGDVAGGGAPAAARSVWLGPRNLCRRRAAGAGGLDDLGGHRPVLPARGVRA